MSKESETNKNSKRLFKAVLNEKINEVKLIIAGKNFDNDYIGEDKDGNEYDIITLATKLNNYEIVKILLNNSPQFLPTSMAYWDNDLSPIYVAYQNNNLDILQLLLEHGLQNNSNNYPENIQDMMKTAELAFRIYAFDSVEENDNDLLKKINQKEELQELFLNSFKNYLWCKENLPGNDKTLLEYSEHIKTEYQNIFTQLFLEKIVDVVDLTQKEYINNIQSVISTLTYNPHDIKLVADYLIENCLKSILNDLTQITDPMKKEAVFGLYGNKALSMEVNSMIYDYILKENDSENVSNTISGES